MGQVIKKENITIVTGQYPDPQNPQAMKNRYKTIGELVTMQNDDGSVNQFGEMWGPHGCTKFNIYEQQQNNQQQANNMGGMQQGYQQPQQQYQQQPQYQQAPQNQMPNTGNQPF